jgi:WD40 repeat protein
LLWSVCPVTVAGKELVGSASADGTVRIWDPGAGEQLSILEGHRAEVGCVCPVTVTGRELLASAGDDGTVRIWDPGTGACLLTVPTHYPPQATAWVAGSLAIGLGAGILVIKPRAAV